MVKIIVCITIYVLLLSSIYADSLGMTYTHPDIRSYSCMIMDRVNSRMVHFGGWNNGIQGGKCFNDVWSFDCATETWELITPSGTAPQARIEPVAVYYEEGNEMIIFGGRLYGSYLNDLWSLDLTMGSETWNQIMPSGTQPSLRTGAKGIIDPLNNRMVVFGGTNGIAENNETWSLNLDTYTWTQLWPAGSPPPIRFAHCAEYDPVGHRMIIYGGAGGGQPIMNDVWVLDLTLNSEAWQQLFPSGSQPGPRCQHFSVFDEAHNALVIGFGYDHPPFMYYNDLWTLNLNPLTWQRITPSGVSVVGRRGSAAAYDPFNNRAIIFGGNQDNYCYFGDTYVLTIDSVAVLEYPQKDPVNDTYIKILSNPSRLPCQINAFLPFPSDVALKVYDASGRLVNTLIKDQRNSGNYVINWDGKDNNGKKVAAGKYFINLELDGVSEVEKVVVIE